MSFCVMFLLFCPFLFFSWSLRFGRIADLSNCKSRALSEKNVRVVQNQSVKSRAQEWHKRKFELVTWATCNINLKELKTFRNNYLEVTTSILPHHLAGNLTLTVWTLLQHVRVWLASARRSHQKVVRNMSKLVQINFVRQRNCARKNSCLDFSKNLLAFYHKCRALIGSILW